MKKLFQLFIAALFLISCQGQNENTKKLETQLDSLMNVSYKPDEPGASVLVYKDGKILFQKAYGLADYKTKEAITPDHVFCIGSITKQFTAQAVLLLEEQGKLSIKDPIQKYLPDYPYPDKKITVENLLTHTSGLIDVFENQAWFGLWEKELSPEEFVNVFKNDPLLSEPGTQYHYSNYNYAVLGLIIEKVSGKTYKEFLNENFFQPIGMKNTYIPKTGEGIEKLAKGYFTAQEGIQIANTINLSHLYAAGSIYTCVGDLLKWYLWLSEKYKANDQKIKKALTNYTLADGTKTNNGYGMMLYSVQGMPASGNNGGMLGYTNYTLWIYEDDIVVVLLSNHRYEGEDKSIEARFDVERKAIKLSEAAVGKLSPSLNLDSLKFLAFPEDKLDKYTGMYQVDKDLYRIINRKGNQLYSKISKGGYKRAINPVSDTVFYSNEGSRFEFRFDNMGNVKEANWIKPDGSISVGKRTDLPIPEEKKPVKISDADYDAICGLYKMMVVFDVKVYRNDSISIVVESKQRGKSIFYPESPTRFFFFDDENTVIDFTKNKKGLVDGMKMTMNGRTFSAKRDK